MRGLRISPAIASRNREARQGHGVDSNTSIDGSRFGAKRIEIGTSISVCERGTCITLPRFSALISRKIRIWIEVADVAAKAASSLSGVVLKVEFI